MTSTSGGYYIPHGSHWPIIGSIGLFVMLHGFGNEAHIWDDFAPAVAPYYRTIAMDLLETCALLGDRSPRIRVNKSKY